MDFSRPEGKCWVLLGRSASSLHSSRQDGKENEDEEDEENR